jgi:hypothetical protein
MSAQSRRVSKISSGLASVKGEGTDVCNFFGTNQKELKDIINLKEFPKVLNEELFGVFGVDITVMNVRPNGNLILLVKPPVSSPLHGHLFVFKIIMENANNRYTRRLDPKILAELNDNIIAEHVISKIMLNLVKYKVTPHVLGSIFTSPLIDITLDSLNQKIIQYLTIENIKKAVTHLSKSIDIVSAKTHIAGMLQESFMIRSNDYSIEPLTKTIVFDNFKFYYKLFQIIYTLAVFRRIGLKHQDFHTDNIIVLTEILAPSESKKYVKYTIGGKSYYLEDIGISTAIIDFGMSVKQPSPEANNVAMQHTQNIDLSPESTHRVKSATAKFPKCYHLDFNSYSHMSEFLNVGSPDNDAMMYDDLYKLIRHLHRHCKGNVSLAFPMIKQIFFKPGANIDKLIPVRLSQYDEMKYKRHFYHTSASEYADFITQTNSYEDILKNIFQLISIKLKSDVILDDTILILDENIIESYDIDNLSIKASQFRAITKKVESATAAEIDSIKSNLNPHESSIDVSLPEIESLVSSLALHPNPNSKQEIFEIYAGGGKQRNNKSSKRYSKTRKTRKTRKTHKNLRKK